MDHFDERVARARSVLGAADLVLVGGGAGLSAAAGLTYSGSRFTETFADFIERYGLEDMYSASFYPFETPEERWAHWARQIHVNRFAPPACELYRDLRSLLGITPHFVITTNVDGQFEKAGFPRERVFEVQGNYGHIQCARACHDGLYDDELLVSRWMAATEACRIPSSMVPACPVCRGPMDVNLRHDEFFVQGPRWYEASARYRAFVSQLPGKAVVLLELGVGFNTPGIIRFPFEQLLAQLEGATLIRMNRDDPTGPAVNQPRTIAFDEEMSRVVHALRERTPHRGERGDPAWNG